MDKVEKACLLVKGFAFLNKAVSTFVCAYRTFACKRLRIRGQRMSTIPSFDDEERGTDGKICINDLENPCEKTVFSNLLFYSQKLENCWISNK